jgi:hypothetical protein
VAATIYELGGEKGIRVRYPRYLVQHLGRNEWVIARTL